MFELNFSGQNVYENNVTHVKTGYKLWIIS